MSLESTPNATRPESLEQQVRARVESLAYLPTTATVAMKFIELGENPNAELKDYCKVIGADCSLSARLLSLANSSWFGVRNRITRPQTAINLLGLNTVRTLAISYCLAGLQSELDLTQAESRMFWSASLYKAVAAKYLVGTVDRKRGEEAFAAALLQDFAIPIMYTVAKEVVLGWLQDNSLDWRARLRQERETFNLDHCEVGRLVAQKLDLPDFYIDAIAFHHDHARLAETMPTGPLVQGLRLASLFPHHLGSWNAEDLKEAQGLLCGGEMQAAPTQEMLDAIQQEFDQLLVFFEPAGTVQVDVKELLKLATRAAVDSTTRLVGTVHELMQETVLASRQVTQILQEHSRLEEAVHRDALTGALNRDGLQARAVPLLRKASRYGNGFAVIFLDLDHFKELNDSRGHDVGDAALRDLVESLHGHVRDTDLVARMGGDEFVVLLNDCGREYAEQVMEQAVRSLRQRQHYQEGEKGPHITLSAGFLWVQPSQEDIDLDALITAADQLMYDAKRAGGNRICRGTFPPGPAPAARVADSVVLTPMMMPK